MAKINGVGEYFTNPVSGVGGDPSGIGSVYRDGSLGQQNGAFQDGSLGAQAQAFQDGSLGATIRSAPQRSTRQRMMRGSSFGLAGDGLGDVSEAQVAGIIVLGVVVRGIAGYFAGCAMGKEYKWWGAGSAALGGALGLGILGFIAYSKKH